MVDWIKVRDIIREMTDYFAGCRDNAAPGSDAEQKFGEWIGALIILELTVNGRIAEEDDGK